MTIAYAISIQAPDDQLSPSRAIFNPNGTPINGNNNFKAETITRAEPAPTAKKSKSRTWLVVVVLVICLAIGTFVAMRKPRQDKEDVLFEEGATSAPTMSGDEECLMKRIKITEICDVPDLDDDIFGSDFTMDIKVLVNDKLYWPQQVQRDCLEEYGSYEDSCVIPDTTLIGCFQLRNSIELPFGLDGASIEDQIKVTIYDVDIFSDDIIDILIPKEEWYRPTLCEKKEFEFQARKSSARIKMVVDFGEVENPCGVEEETFLAGLNEAAAELEQMRVALLEYVKAPQQERRLLIFGALVGGFRFLAKGARSFAGLFTRSRASNTLSTIADMTQIGSMLFSVLGGDENGSSNTNEANEALFEQVFERFDLIDSQLDDIQSQIKGGFDAIKLVIQEEFAEQELDDWITFRLGIKLRGDYQGYTDRSHTALSRPLYEETFRETCNGDYSPYNIFQVIYSHSCMGCERFSGKARQYFLDTYVDLANTNFEVPMDRVLWFRKSFGTVIIGALTEVIYFYSVCLYRSKDECEVDDPVWEARLKEMGDALEEIVESLGEAETRLE